MDNRRFFFKCKILSVLSVNICFFLKNLIPHNYNYYLYVRKVSYYFILFKKYFLNLIVINFYKLKSSLRN